MRLSDERRASAQPLRFDDPEIVFPNPRDSALTLLRFANLGLGIDNVEVIEDEECSSRSLGRTESGNGKICPETVVGQLATESAGPVLQGRQPIDRYFEAGSASWALPAP